MKMLRLLVPSCLVLFAAGCGTSPLQACKDRGVADCKKMWTCSGVPVKLGNSQADCEATMNNLCTLANGNCLNGKVLDTSKMVACTADIESATCESYATLNSANCAAAKCGD